MPRRWKLGEEYWKGIKSSDDRRIFAARSVRRIARRVFSFAPLSSLALHEFYRRSDSAGYAKFLEGWGRWSVNGEG